MSGALKKKESEEEKRKKQQQANPFLQLGQGPLDSGELMREAGSLEQRAREAYEHGVKLEMKGLERAKQRKRKKEGKRKGRKAKEKGN